MENEKCLQKEFYAPITQIEAIYTTINQLMLMERRLFYVTGTRIEKNRHMLSVTIYFQLIEK